MYFSQIIFNVFPRSHFLKYFSQMWPEARAYAIIIYKVWMHMIVLFAGLEQVSYNYCPDSTRMQLWQISSMPQLS